MKHILKSTIAMILCAVIAVTAIGLDTAYAASKASIKAKFNDKTVTLAKDVNKKPAKPKISNINKKWGEPEKTVMDNGVYYMWQNGRSYVVYYISDGPTEDFPNDRTYMRVSIGDKNGAICGIKVGTKKKKADKILKDLGMKEGEFTKSDIRITCYYENGKVTSLFVDLENL